MLIHVAKDSVEIAAQAAKEYCRANGITFDTNANADALAEKVVDECRKALPAALAECGRASVRGELAYPVLMAHMRKAGILAARRSRLDEIEARWKFLTADERREFLGRLCSAADSIDSKAANLLGDK